MSLKKGEAQEKLLEVLGRGSKALEEILNEGIMPKRTLYDVRKKLLVKGKIKEIDDYSDGKPIKKLSLIGAEKLVSDQELTFLLKLADSDNHEIRFESLQDLKALSHEKGIPQARARDFLLSKIGDPHYEDGLKHILETLLHIIEYAKRERRYDIISEMRANGEKFVRLISDKSRDGMDRLISIRIMGELEDPLVLPHIMDLIEKDEESQLAKSTKYWDKIDPGADVQQLLVTTLVKLSKDNKVLVWKHLYHLVSKEDKRIAAKAKNILGYIRMASASYTRIASTISPDASLTPSYKEK